MYDELIQITVHDRFKLKQICMKANCKAFKHNNKRS